MEPPRLTYFEMRGRAEPTRLLLHATGTAFEDARIVGRDQWAALEPTLPFGILPVYESREVRLAESHAILRHLGRRLLSAHRDEADLAALDVAHEPLAESQAGALASLDADAEAMRYLGGPRDAERMRAVFEEIARAPDEAEERIWSLIERTSGASPASSLIEPENRASARVALRAGFRYSRPVVRTGARTLHLHVLEAPEPPRERAR